MSHLLDKDEQRLVRALWYGASRMFAVYYVWIAIKDALILWAFPPALQERIFNWLLPHVPPELTEDMDQARTGS